jgi:hypothetical protein
MVDGYLGIVADVSRSIIHEGRRTAIVRNSGAVEETPLFQASAGFEIRPDEVPTISLQLLRDRMDQAARDMAKQRSEGFFKTIEDAVENIGNTVNGKGQAFTPELVFEMLEKMWIDFDAQGQPRLPTVTINPAQEPQVRRAFESIQTDPNLARRFTELIDKKREEWRAREASRKLVG